MFWFKITLQIHPLNFFENDFTEEYIETTKIDRQFSGINFNVTQEIIIP